MISFEMSMQIFLIHSHDSRKSIEINDTNYYMITHNDEFATFTTQRGMKELFDFNDSLFFSHRTTEIKVF